MSKNSFVFPSSKRFHMVYRCANGQCKSYSVSNPIEARAESFNAYAFGHGVRTFVKDRVIKLRQLD